MTSLVAQYNRNLASYEAITQQFQSMLTMLLESQALHIQSISGRTKDQMSLANKIAKKSHKYGALDEITDLCGVRIITYYEDEVDKIAAFICKHFSIDRENSIDKRKKLSPSEFGYASLHLIVNLPVNARGICQGAYDRICKVEIQIRSILQHAWAEIEHDLEYKNPAGTSDEIRRRFSRAAALLEAADEEFRSLRTTLAPQASPAEDASLPSFRFQDTAAASSASAHAPQTAVKNPLASLLLNFPNLGWAAFVTLLFFLLAFLADWYFGTKMTHLAMTFTSLLVG